MSEEKLITLSINGRDEALRVPSHRTLLEALRELGHVEVKRGCEKGDCGTCAVLIDGVAMDSCLMLARLAEGREITTVRGLGEADTPHPLQQTFADGGGIQCGYCTPGMIMASEALLRQTPKPDDEEIRTALGGNICRCTGYVKIIEAVSTAAAERSHDG